MPDLVTLDSSVIVAAIRQQEEHHDDSRQLLEQVKEGNLIAVQPYTVLIEVGAAIRRRTGSQPLSEQVTENLKVLTLSSFSTLIQPVHNERLK